MSIQNLLDNFDPIFRRISATMSVEDVVAPAHAALLAAYTNRTARPVTASFSTQVANTGALRAA